MDRNVKRRPYKKANVKRSDGDRYKKFIGNKNEGQGFADKRKRKVQHEYMKILKKQRKDEQYQSENRAKRDRFEEQESSSGVENITTFTKSKWQSEQREAEKARKKTEALKRIRERDEALSKYKDNKQTKNKKLCKRTYKGQPVMKNQIEHLLTKIEKQVNQT